MVFAAALCVIPARYGSTRFRGKALELFRGVPIVVRAAQVGALAVGADRVIVATDDYRIASVVRSAGFRAEMTDQRCASGTARIAWLLAHCGSTLPTSNVIVNLQGDEPAARASHVRQLVHRFHTLSATVNLENCVVTLCAPITSADQLFDPNCVKVVRDHSDRALYFSRAAIPSSVGGDAELRQRVSEERKHHRNVGSPNTSRTPFLRHIGMYAFSPSFAAKHLSEHAAVFGHSMLESCESLEQLRWLEYGCHIYVHQVQGAFRGVDTPHDLAILEHELQTKTLPLD